ncbi:hypothetical protein [Mycolicibacterium setense]|uniref:hypothetical protein n=1 Tax=Mycolicibacterium setense TaxID=431269 RepID=UPI000689BB62|nr:hypothetical protein [Mycolicibacterium setense]MCV7110583.1 hypothetical protein [Mycolicibacterium setense]
MPKALRWLNFVLSGGLTIAFVAWAVVSGTQRSWLTAPALLGIAAFWVTIIATGVVSSSAVARGTFGPAGTVLRPDKRLDMLAFATLIVGCLAAAWCALLGATGMPVYPIAGEYSTQFTLGSVVVAAGLGIALLFLIRRGGIGRVTLTSDGFSFTGSGGRWDDVTAITDHSTSSTSSPWTPLVMVMADGTECILAEPGVYTPGGHGLSAFVEFYWRHPQYRFELANGQALARLRAQFLCAVSPG